MLVAALDTATLTLSCALVDVEPGAPPSLRCSRTAQAPAKAQPGSTGHSGLLPSALSDLLVAEGLTIPDVEGYAIGLGPGSFTGLRIGLATWKGLAYANRRPIAGVSSLAAMALEAAGDAEPGTLLVPLLDARKGEVYAGFYRARDGSVTAVAPEVTLLPAALLARVAALPADGPGPRGFGTGYAAYAEALEAGLSRLVTPVVTPTADAVAALAAAALFAKPYDPQALFALEPHYVRASEAEVRFPKGLGPDADR